MAGEANDVQFNAQQQEAYDFLKDFLSSSDRYAGIFGYAGTGKSFVVSKVLEQVYDMVAVTAPTHKAVAVLASMGNPEADHMRFGTIHSLLGLRAFKQGGTTVFRPNPNKPPPIRGYSLLIVDECSMLDSYMLGLIDDAASSYELKVIFMGDPLQLPPVTDNPEIERSPSFDVQSVTLSQIMRYGGAIETTVASVREPLANGEPQKIPKPTSAKDESGEAVVTRSSDDWFDSAMAKIDAGRDVKIITYTNNRVASLNSLIRKRLYGADAPTFIEGEKLVAVSSLIKGNTIILYTEEEFSIVKVERVNHKGFDSWRLSINQPSEGSGVTEEIFVLDPSARSKFAKQVKYLAQEAKISKRWGEFWELKEAFADVRPPFATTIHKCLHPDTLVETKRGLERIGSIDLVGEIATPDGIKPYRDWVGLPEGPALDIRTREGFGLTVTPEHGLDVWNSEAYVREEARCLVAGGVGEGSWLRFKLGTTCCVEGLRRLPLHSEPDVRVREYHVPTHCTPDVAEWLGLMVADGTVYDRGFRLVKRHSEVVDRFSSLCEDLFGATPRDVSKHFDGTPGAEVSSTHLASWIRKIDGLAPHEKRVPRVILESGLDVQRAFLRGFFEDGGVNIKDGAFDHAYVSQKSIALLRDVQVMLLRMGIVGHVKNYDTPALYLYAEHAVSFADQIGYVSDIKNQRLKLAVSQPCRTHVVPVSKHEVSSLWAEHPDSLGSRSAYQDGMTKGRLSRQVAERARDYFREMGEPMAWLEERLAYHHSPVASITETTCPSVCVEVPDGHRFLQNGCAGWNSQGSTYENVYVDQRDVSSKTRQDPEMRARLLYVGYSRASKSLNVFW